MGPAKQTHRLGLCLNVIVHTIVHPAHSFVHRAVCRPKWHPLDVGYHDSLTYCARPPLAKSLKKVRFGNVQLSVCCLMMIMNMTGRKSKRFNWDCSRDTGGWFWSYNNGWRDVSMHRIIISQKPMETTWTSIILIPKTIGNRKRDCAWGCARGINTTGENLQIEKHKSVR